MTAPAVTTHPPGLTDMQLLALHAQHHHRLPMWTVYRSTTGRYVARMVLSLPGPAERAEAVASGKPYTPQITGFTIYGEKLEAVRAALPAGLHRMSRFEADAPDIVETWL